MGKVLQLNLENEICPYTLTKSIKKANEVSKELEAGAVLEVRIDHPPATDNIPDELKRRGYKVKTEKKSSAFWLLIITK